ncbi:ABC transporter permease [Microbacterium excoecariae]|uniref:ABC transporter permease n=1 Tax=Microbacterium excoecariae TaxID=2715210 RepID=UPI00140D27E8|nr:ABC transporter permease [Microbacterium excoecariae]NHI17435.1 ABC transporter permease [Microbacterium excoecariae]
MTRRRATLAAGIALAGLIALIALVSFVWLPHPLSDTSGGRLVPPGTDGYPLGTDRLGRDLVTQVMIGARIALASGLGAVAIAAVLGVACGIAAAFARGWLNDTIAAFLDILIAFPTLLVAMLIVAAQPASLGTAILAIGIAQSAIIARLTRILAGRVLEADFVTAARAAGTRWPGLVVGHILPNVWTTLAVSLALQFGLAVLAEASLSYLGLGAPPPNASWGRLLQEAQQTVLVQPAGAIVPGILLIVLVVGVNLIADGLRDVLDPGTPRVGRAS